ncbi:MAG: NAD kinase [Bacteroidetes bacterium]|nr:NAD kinase [Bacteroidota bacterium]MDA0929784.1 NAD kinase [Bacteroidota bacterium]
MKILLFGKSLGEEDVSLLQGMRDFLIRKNCGVCVYEPYNRHLLERHGLDLGLPIFSERNVPEDSDVLIGLGGDGTILEAATVLKATGIPMLGINLGRLGFLSPVPKPLVEQALTSLTEGHFTIEKRGVLVAEVEGIEEEAKMALNEVTLLKRDSSSMIELRCLLDGQYFNTYRSDGLIVSTPTGSTGYSLSCGGPIVHPSAPVLVITPIAPHNLTQRPFVVSDGAVIELQCTSRTGDYLVSLDSRSYPLPDSQPIRIRKAAYSASFVHLKSMNYLQTLRNKLLWGLDARN